MWTWFKEKVEKAGRVEKMDDTAIEIPLKFRRELSLEERVAQVVQSQQWSELMRARGGETFEEANDFDVDDEDPTSPHEIEGEAYERQLDQMAAAYHKKIARDRARQRASSDKAPKTEGDKPPQNGVDNAAPVHST